MMGQHHELDGLRGPLTMALEEKSFEITKGLETISKAIGMCHYEQQLYLFATSLLELKQF